MTPLVLDRNCTELQMKHLKCSFSREGKPEQSPEMWWQTIRVLPSRHMIRHLFSSNSPSFQCPQSFWVCSFFFFFLQPSNYSALLHSFCISSQRLHHLNDEERESCACRSGSCTLQSQPAWGWGSHNDQSSRSFTEQLLEQGQSHCLGKSHCLCFFVTPERGNIHRLFGKGKCGHWHFGCTRGFSVRSLKDLTPQLSLAWHLNQRSWWVST